MGAFKDFYLSEAMSKHLDFVAKSKKAKKMTISQLNYAIEDCMDCVKKGIDVDYYKDEASVYVMEIDRRQRKENKGYKD